ncbi:MAG: imidazoleglycerol-phosphate dehydratase [Gemmatimonadales bacterium]|nr:imidazoleglycerol-phosphate dehydratase [Gemmatimonadales bacterium]
MSVITRQTKETNIRLELVRTGPIVVSTTVPFLDHMFVTWARYAGLGLTLEATGDLRHHLIEDTAIALGLAVREEFPPPIVRYGQKTVPMDDAVVEAVLDLGGRPYYEGPLPSSLYDHWMRSFADNAQATLHLMVHRGTDRHHIVEAGFKALGMAVRQAVQPTDEIASTKGAVRVDR